MTASSGLSSRKKRTLIKKSKVDDDSHDDHFLIPGLPDDLVFYNILTRVSAPVLARNNEVSKLWYDTINDKRFAASHLSHPNRNQLKLVFNLFNAPKDGAKENHFFTLEQEEFELVGRSLHGGPSEPVGDCNGLSCLKAQPSHDKGGISVVNPVRGETLNLVYPVPKTVWGAMCKHLCHGFGFDSSTQEYKVVIIYTSPTILGNDQEFTCMVFTLGSKSWRKIKTRTSDMSPPPGCAPFLGRMLITSTWKCTQRSATLCGGECLWRITNPLIDFHEIELLLSFDIHSETIHFIRLPTECVTTPTTRAAEHMHTQVDHHLLEYKGYPCVARMEKIMASRRDQGQDGLKVGLYVLKDKVKQMWIKEKAFDVRVEEEGLVPQPFFCCDLDTAAAAATRTPPTRILSFYDQVILYWFDGESLVLYNLDKKHLKVVRGTGSCNEQIRDVFVTKKAEDGNVCCPYMDYQLYAQVENASSMKTFLPKGEVREFRSFGKFEKFLKRRKRVGWLTTGRKSRIRYAFV